MIFRWKMFHFLLRCVFIIQMFFLSIYVCHSFYLISIWSSVTVIYFLEMLSLATKISINHFYLRWLIRFLKLTFAFADRHIIRILSYITNFARLLVLKTRTKIYILIYISHKTSVWRYKLKQISNHENVLYWNFVILHKISYVIRILSIR